MTRATPMAVLRCVAAISVLAGCGELTEKAHPEEDGEAGPAGQGEAGPAGQDEVGPAGQGEAGPAGQGEAGPAGQDEAGPSNLDADAGCTTVDESQTAELACGPGERIERIDFASYGTPSGNCTDGFSASLCHASTSRQVVEDACLGEPSCAVAATNTVFGDACDEQSKRLVVVYACGGSDEGGITWVSGRRGQSCDAVCNELGGNACDPLALGSVQSAADILAVASMAGVTCQSRLGATESWSYATNPGQCTAESCCGNGGCNGICTYGAPSSPSCSASDGGYSRFCPCVDSPATDCAGVPGGSAVTDDCGVCDADPTNDNTTCGTPCGSGAAACSAPTPICGPDSVCTNRRWVEPISTLPERWRSSIDTSVWTKWVRSIVPIIGQRLTKDVALLEVAYYAETVHMPEGRILVPDLVDSMLGAHPTRFSVYPACPNAFMHPAVEPTMSSGGGGWTNTLVSEDWVLRYPKCTGDYAVPCDQIPEGVLCNNCQWQNPSEPETCRDTLAHEHGHTCDLHRRNFMDPSIDAIARQVFGTHDIEGPAWAAGQYFMNPSLESATGRDRGTRIMSPEKRDYWSVTHKFTMSGYPAGWGYALKDARCPEMGLTEPCPDTVTRAYSVPLDSDS